MKVLCTTFENNNHAIAARRYIRCLGRNAAVAAAEGCGDAPSPPGKCAASGASARPRQTVWHKNSGDEGVATTSKRRGVASTLKPTASFRLSCLGLLLLNLLAIILAGCAIKLSKQSDNRTKPTYIFTSFREDSPQGLRFLYSFDGYHWTNIPGRFLIPNAGPSKLLRDPSLLCGPDGVFHLVWTTGWHGDRGFGYASSRDLVHWSEQQFVPVMTNEPTTVNVWAPELFYDEREKQFIIVWASTIPWRYPERLEATNNNHRLYFTTTRDFKTFTPEKLFFEPRFSVIDAFMLKDKNRYVLLHKDNTRPMLNLRVAFSKSPLGPWHSVSEPLTEKFTEGPCALKVGDDWLIYFDAYREKIYGALKTRDFKMFTNITKEVSFPEGHKHGTALRVSPKILDGLLRAAVLQSVGER